MRLGGHNLSTTFLCRYPSRPGNMIHLSDPDAAARHGPADKVFDGLGMLAGIIGANTINVCGCGVEPQPQRPPAETSNVEPEMHKRGSRTAPPIPCVLRSALCPELKKRNILNGLHGSLGCWARRIGCRLPSLADVWKKIASRPPARRWKGRDDSFQELLSLTSRHGLGAVGGPRKV